MSKSKIDLVKMDELLRAGKSPKEIAVFSQVSPVAIWKARKKVSLTIANTLTPETTNKIVENDLDLRKRMTNLTQTINQQLQEAEADVLNAKGAEKRAIQEVLVKLTAEARKQIEMILRIGQVWYSHKAYAEFREEALAYLDQMSPGARETIMQGLQEKQALRRTPQGKRKRKIKR